MRKHGEDHIEFSNSQSSMTFVQKKLTSYSRFTNIIKIKIFLHYKANTNFFLTSFSDICQNLILKVKKEKFFHKKIISLLYKDFFSSL